MTLKSFFFVCLIILLAGCTEPAITEKWEPFDLSFTLGKEVENPFDVDFSALVTRPDGSEFETGGFYDGERTWKIRLSCSMQGEWQLVTRSPERALNYKKRSFTCIANSDPEVHGRLMVNPKNPHYFMYEDGTKPFLLGYEADWLWAIDLGRDNLDRTTTFLDKLSEVGFNYILFNIFAYDTRWRTGKTEEYDFGPPEMFPWEGTYENPDYTRFNLSYWQHYDRVLEALHERGFTAHIMFKVYNKAVNWPEKRSPGDDRYFQYVVNRYAAFPNIVWDYSKESYYEEEVAYKQDRLQLIRRTDPYDHLVTLHDDKEIFDGHYDELIDFHADQNHEPEMYQMTLEQRAYKDWPVFNVEFGYEHGPGGITDKTFGRVQTPEEVCHRAWKLAMAGAYVAYYYTYTAWDVIRLNDKPVGYLYFGIYSDFFNSVDFHSFRPYRFEEEPINELPTEPGFYSMINDRGQAIYYLPEAKAFRLVEKPSPDIKGYWLQPLTGERVDFVPPEGTETDPPEEWKMGPAVLFIFQN